MGPTLLTLVPDQGLAPLQLGGRPGTRGLEPRLTLGTPGGMDQAGACDGSIEAPVLLVSGVGGVGRPWWAIGRDPYWLKGSSVWWVEGRRGSGPHQGKRWGFLFIQKTVGKLYYLASKMRFVSFFKKNQNLLLHLS